MASVFLSYDREDSRTAGSIARALEKAGHEVWWDRHIKSGAQYSKEIEQALKAADAVVVLWSERSVDSAWVRDEAADGRDSGRLVPVRIGKVDPPLGFRQISDERSHALERPHQLTTIPGNARRDRGARRKPAGSTAKRSAPRHLRAWTAKRGSRRFGADAHRRYAALAAVGSRPGRTGRRRGRCVAGAFGASARPRSVRQAR